MAQDETPSRKRRAAQSTRSTRPTPIRVADLPTTSEDEGVAGSIEESDESSEERSAEPQRQQAPEVAAVSSDDESDSKSALYDNYVANHGHAGQEVEQPQQQQQQQEESDDEFEEDEEEESEEDESDAADADAVAIEGDQPDEEDKRFISPDKMSQRDQEALIDWETTRLRGSQDVKGKRGEYFRFRLMNLLGIIPERLAAQDRDKAEAALRIEAVFRQRAEETNTLVGGERADDGLNDKMRNTPIVDWEDAGWLLSHHCAICRVHTMAQKHMFKLMFTGRQDPITFLADILKPVLNRGRGRPALRGEDGSSDSEQAEEGGEEEEEEYESDPADDDSDGSMDGKQTRRMPRVDTICLTRAYTQHVAYMYPARVDLMLKLFLRKYFENTPVKRWPNTLEELVVEIIDQHLHQLNAHWEQSDYDIKKGLTGCYNKHTLNKLKNELYALVAQPTEDEILDGVDLTEYFKKYAKELKRRRLGDEVGNTIEHLEYLADDGV